MLVRQGRHRGGGLLIPTPPATIPTNWGPRLNDWGYAKVTGGGGHYPDGIAWLPGGDYYCDPFDMGPSGGYRRAYDPNKPNNNWLLFGELDGPGTVTIDLRPESAASVLGQTQTQAYNDTTHGGAFTNVLTPGSAGTAGDFRWCFDGAFTFANGSFFLKQTAAAVRPTRLKFHGTNHYFSIEEWRRQFDFICGLRGVAVPGYTIPNTETYGLVVNDSRFKGDYFPTPIRCEGFDYLDVIRADMGPAGDDAIFTGADYVNVIGTVIHEVKDKGVAPEWHHPDVFQSAGGHDLRLIDCTLNGHLNVAADAGDLSDTVFDRIWQGVAGATGGSIYQWHGHTMGPTNKFGSGAPTTRLSGHYYKVFSNGMDYDHGTNGPQVAIDYATGETTGSGPWRAGMTAYSTQTASLLNFSVAVPSGVSVNLDGFAVVPDAATGLANFLGSPAVPHQLFRAAYGTDELDAVMTDYGLVFD